MNRQELDDRQFYVDRIEAKTGIYFEGTNGRGLFNLKTDELKLLYKYLRNAPDQSE